jgi:hypothetical protein
VLFLWGALSDERSGLSSLTYPVYEYNIGTDRVEITVPLLPKGAVLLFNAVGTLGPVRVIATEPLPINSYCFQNYLTTKIISEALNILRCW